MAPGPSGHSVYLTRELPDGSGKEHRSIRRCPGLISSLVMSRQKDFSHLDASGRASMVDISEKKTVRRVARAEGFVSVSPATLSRIEERGLPKGNPFEVARLAGIQAAKQTALLIPLCHQLLLDHVDVQIEVVPEGFKVHSTVTCRQATGVEMEALTAVSVAALTLYDMCKAVDPEIEIRGVRLVEKVKEAAGTANPAEKGEKEHDR